MEGIQAALRPAVGTTLSSQNYDQSFTFYRSWFDIAQTHFGISPSPDQIFNAIFDSRQADSVEPMDDQLIHPTAHLILRFASDAESDHILAPHNVGLQSRLCARILQEFFKNNMGAIWAKKPSQSYQETLQNVVTDANFIARLANMGYVEEAVIRNQILQSLTSHTYLHGHQAGALIVLFKLAGATFGEYADPSVVDHCFKLLENHCKRNPAKHALVQEIVELRKHDWEGLTPPPVLTTGKPKPAGTNQKDPAATPIVKSAFLGLPNVDPEPQIPRSPPLEPATTSEADTVPATPITQSPSISIATLSDFTFADTSDDESPIDPTAITPHDTFYLEDGNVEVLCQNTLFRVHPSILSFHSPALRQMFAQANLATADSPNGCPRVLSSDTARDFATLLKMIYLPGFPEKNKVPDFATFSSLLRITAKYELPTVQSQLFEVVCDAYPKTFNGLTPSKPLGESVFSGPTPHPNEVLNLFVQQKLTSALPMAYYMAARRGPNSLMNTRHPAGARLSPEILQASIEGLFALREMELKETHRLIFESITSHPCSSPNCPSRGTVGTKVPDAHHKIVDKITGSARSGTKLLEVLSLDDICGGESHGFCESCVKRWESGHAEVRKKAWDALPDVFGLKA